MRNKAEGDQRQLHVAFNSLSASSTHPLDVALPSRGTPALGRNIVDLHNHFSTIFDEVSVSILPGRNVNLPVLASYLQENNIPLHSVDVPDVKQLPIALLQAAGNLMRPLRGQAPDITRAKNHVGWALSNVESRKQQRKRTQEGLLVGDTTDAEKLVKANAAFWNENRQGEELIDSLLKSGEKVALAIEIDAPSQTQADYFTFMNRIRADKAHIMRVLYDIDAGHLERSTHYHPDSSNKPAATVVEDVFTDPHQAQHVGIVSLNQYVNGNPESHTRLDGGDVDLEKIVFDMGSAMREGALPTSTTALLETHPGDREWLKTEGVIFLRRLQDAFNRGAGTPKEEAA